MLGGFLDFLGLRVLVLVVQRCKGRRMSGEHVLQDVVEAVGGFHTVLLEAVQTECPDGGCKTEHGRVDPCRSGSDSLAGVVRRGSVGHLFNDAHDLAEANIPGVGHENALLRIDHRFLEDADGLALEEPFAPLRHPVCFGQQPLAVQFPILDLATNGVLREYVHAEWVRVPVPEALSHLLPGVVECRAIFVVLGHGGAAGTRITRDAEIWILFHCFSPWWPSSTDDDMRAPKIWISLFFLTYCAVLLSAVDC